MVNSFKFNSPPLSSIIFSNVVFGLVTAVVIQELGEEARETSLYYRFLDTYREQIRRSKDDRFRNESILTGYSGKVMQYWYRFIEWGKTRVMGLVLWSTRLYIISWIILGVASLTFGAIKRLDPSNTLYTTGQTWLGIAVTIGYAYFGLSGKNNPNAKVKVSEKENPVESESNTNENEQEGPKPNGGANETKTTFTNESGEVKVIATRHALEGEFNRYDSLCQNAVRDENFEDAAAYQKCLHQLEKLRESFPTVDELKEQIGKARTQLSKAIKDSDFVTAGKLKKEVDPLEKQLESEGAANAGTDLQE